MQSAVTATAANPRGWMAAVAVAPASCKGPPGPARVPTALVRVLLATAFLSPTSSDFSAFLLQSLRGMAASPSFFARLAGCPTTDFSVATIPPFATSTCTSPPVAPPTLPSGGPSAPPPAAALAFMRSRMPAILSAALSFVATSHFASPASSPADVPPPLGLGPRRFPVPPSTPSSILVLLRLAWCLLAAHARLPSCSLHRQQCIASAPLSLELLGGALLSTAALAMQPRQVAWPHPGHLAASPTPVSPPQVAQSRRSLRQAS